MTATSERGGKGKVHFGQCRTRQIYVQGLTILGDEECDCWRYMHFHADEIEALTPRPTPGLKESMKTVISVTRRVRYSSIVEMDEDTFKRLDAALDSDDSSERKRAREELNEMVDVSDWQDDSLDDLDDFYEYKEEAAK